MLECVSNFYDCKVENNGKYGLIKNGRNGNEFSIKILNLNMIFSILYSSFIPDV